MKNLKSLRYLRRHVLNQYEHHEIEATLILDEGDDPKKEVDGLILFAHDALTNGKSPRPEGKKVVESVEVKKEKSTTPPPTTEIKKENKAAPKEEKQVEANPQQELPLETKKEEKTVQKETTVTAKRTTTTQYDRTYDPHKQIVGLWLDVAYPKWRDVEILKKCSNISKDLTGKIELLDAKGEILASFKETFSKALDAALLEKA